MDKIDEMMENELQFIILSSGEKCYEKGFMELKKNIREKAVYRL